MLYEEVVVDIYAGKPPWELPTYSASDVGAMLGLPYATVSSWSFGTTYGRTPEKRRFSPVIRPADRRNRLLSFINLVEIHVLSALRRKHRVSLPNVRKAVLYLGRELESRHPLAEQQMLTDGQHIFVERLGRLINASQQGQEVMRSILVRYLERVDRDRAGELVRLFPFSRLHIEDAPRFVVIDPCHRFGRPFLIDCGVETAAIADRYKAGDSVDDLAEDFGTTRAEIEEAIRYESLAA